MSDPPVLRTDRLELRPPRADDLGGLIALVTPAAVNRFLVPGVEAPSAQFERLLRSAGSWSLYGYGMFVIRRHGDPAIVGVGGVFHSWRGFGRGLDDVPEAGWIFAHPTWGQGLAGEAMRAVLAWFDAGHGRRRIACMIEQGNIASQRLAAALGFAEYDRFNPPENNVGLVLYERL